MFKLNKNSVFLLLTLISSLILSGCQTVGKTLNLDTDLTLTFNTSSDINPDNSNTPSPLFVRFYELKSKSIFEKAEFIDLYERDKEVLGGDLISKQELKRLTPGETRKETFVLNQDTRYIAVFSEFFRYSDSQYRLVVPVHTNNIFNDKVVVNISGNTMSISKKK
ncbi:type VI secretion system lipoprotein TssJ [Aliikangiella sp. IMCC44359]|uniref:type VI secretion system lipoprotein TssJ n=1 Tax=Aliikangiella sp. IMCC44359 TaxID=3459125 RepID=UPI00403B2B19